MNAEAHGAAVEYHDARELLKEFRLDFLWYSEFKSRVHANLKAMSG